MNRKTLLLLVALLSWSCPAFRAAPMESSFTYQGRLDQSGAPANGSYDLIFQLFDNSTGGSQVGSTLTNTATPVTDGLFTVTLDFGSVFDGSARWLEIGVRTNGGSAFTTLAPRQPLTAAPYASYAPSAGMAAVADSANAVAAANISGILADNLLSSNVARLDSSPNFSGTVSAAGFQGNGALPWLIVGQTNTQAAANTTYLLTNAAETTVTLPTNPQVGDVIRVSGNGAGGWRIAQNDGQSILMENQGGILGSTWVPRYTNFFWGSLASSSDGMKLAATATISATNGVYLSEDGGENWSLSLLQPNCYGVACSADGSRILVSRQYDLLLLSTNGGGNWMTTGTNSNWGNNRNNVACSADGVTLLAVPEFGPIYVSTNGGQTWEERATLNTWKCVAISADGRRMAAAPSQRPPAKPEA